MITFNQWLNKNRRHSNPVLDRFVETCLDDNDKPKGTASLNEWKTYLKEVNAEKWEFEALEDLWRKYKRRAAA